jgi:hypothetical protein
MVPQSRACGLHMCASAPTRTVDRPQCRPCVGRLLHEKIDVLREKQWEELLGLQREQLELLATLIEEKILSP